MILNGAIINGVTLVGGGEAEIAEFDINDSYANNFIANNVTIDGGIIRNVTFDGLAITEFNDGNASDNATINNSSLMAGTMTDYEIYQTYIEQAELIDSIANNMITFAMTANNAIINNHSINGGTFEDIM